MTPTEFVSSVLDPGIAWCQAVPGWHIPFDDRARLLMLAIAGQESTWTDRVQGGNGPAHGFWQFERGGGVAGVLAHTATSAVAKAVCAATPNLPADSTHVWGRMATPAGDNVACALARLLLWTSPGPLPAYNSEAAAWLYYEHLWRPGKPDRARWALRYPQAMAAMKAHTP